MVALETEATCLMNYGNLFVIRIKQNLHLRPFYVQFIFMFELLLLLVTIELSKPFDLFNIWSKYNSRVKFLGKVELNCDVTDQQNNVSFKHLDSTSLHITPFWVCCDIFRCRIKTAVILYGIGEN